MPTGSLLLLLATGIASASQFSAAVQTASPREAVQQLVDNGDWPRMINAVRNGAADWIALAPVIARASDGAHAAELSVALAAALPRAPNEVLGIADLRGGPVLGVQTLCGVPAGSTGTQSRAQYLADANEAVELLPDVAAIGRAKSLCLKSLAAAR